MYLGAGATISQSLFQPQPYDLLKIFSPISTISSNDVALVVSKNSKFAQLDDFIQESKKANSHLIVGIGLLGSIQHLTAELFKLRAKADFTIVPFRTASAISSALLGGDLDLAFEFIPPVLSQVRNGELRPLAIASATPSKTLSGVPTIAELGIAGFNVASWGMFVAPAQTPAPIIHRLNREVRRALAHPEIVTRLTEMGTRVLGGTPEEARELLTQEIIRWNGVINESNISSK